MKLLTFIELYARGISAHNLRRSYVDDQHRDNPYIEFSRQQIKREESNLPIMYGPFPEDAEQELIELGLMLDALEDAESKVMEVLSSGQVVGLGFTGPHEQVPKCVPFPQWHLLTIDFEKGTADGEELGYVGLRFLIQEQLSDEALEILKSTPIATDDKTQPDTEQAQSNASSPLDKFRQMEDLTWPEVSLTLVAGDHVEISARKATKRVAYAELGLIDRRIGKGTLTRAGDIFMATAIGDASKDSQYKKNLSRLRTELKNAVGITEDPFYPSSIPGRNSARFKLEDARKRGDERAKGKAIHSQYSDNVDYSIGQSLAGDLDQKEEEYPFDTPDGSEDADEYL